MRTFKGSFSFIYSTDILLIAIYSTAAFYDLSFDLTFIIIIYKRIRRRRMSLLSSIYNKTQIIIYIATSPYLLLCWYSCSSSDDVVTDDDDIDSDALPDFSCCSKKSSAMVRSSPVYVNAACRSCSRRCRFSHFRCWRSSSRCGS